MPGKKPVVRPDAKPAAKLTAPTKPPSENDGDALGAAYTAESVSVSPRRSLASKKSKNFDEDFCQINFVKEDRDKLRYCMFVSIT